MSTGRASGEPRKASENMSVEAAYDELRGLRGRSDEGKPGSRPSRVRDLVAPLSEEVAIETIRTQPM